MDDLEEFIRSGALWEPDELEAMCDRLDDLGRHDDDGNTALLGRFLRSVHMRSQLAEVSPRLRTDIEAIVYPRVWKLMEAVRDGVPDGELRTRLEVMNRRLSRLFASE